MALNINKKNQDIGDNEISKMKEILEGGKKEDISNIYEGLKTLRKETKEKVDLNVSNYCECGNIIVGKNRLCSECITRRGLNGER